MTLARLSKRCEKCPLVDTCDYKKYEEIGYLATVPLVSSTTTISAALPVLRETVDIHIDGKIVQVYKDDFMKQINESLYDQLTLKSTEYNSKR
jgi:hypothetical protein